MSGVQQAVFQNQRSFGPPPDAQFNYVTMLLHGDGTNGAQNNTFLDSSTNNFTITRNGNTTQGSFSPYGSNWSNYFGTSDSFYFASNASYAIGTAGAFTVEFWVSPSVFGSNQLRYFLLGQNGTTRIGIENDANGALNVYVGANSASITYNWTPNINQWYHIAVVRSGTTVTLYINGTSVATATNGNSIVADTLFVGGLNWASGYGAQAYISNLRYTNTAVYTSSFTPSTAPLTAISGTLLLTCQSNRFLDNSSIGATALNGNGSPSVQRFNPFGTSTAYSTSVIGGSGYFDGTGDYLTVPYNAAISLGSGNFTIEMWIYPTSSSRATLFLESGDRQGIFIDYSNGNNGISVFATASTGSWSIINGDPSNPGYGSSNTIKVNAWNHFAFVRSGTNWSTYINGTRDLNLTASGTIYEGSGTRYISFFPANGLYLNGYLSDFRIVKGTALYSGTTLTVPTTPLTAVSGTGLLLNTVNAAIFDNAMMNDLETVGNAQISTSVVKYGTGSLYFDGTGDYLIGPSTPNMNFGSGDFTVEAWVYRQVDSGTTQTIYQKGRVADSNFELSFVINTSNQLEVYYSTSGTSATLVATTTASVSQNTWTHVALARSGSTWRVFIGGTLDVSATASVTLYTGTGRISIATNPNGDSPFTGYIDDLRITKGYARYTATFTPPTAALLDTGPY